MTISMTANDRSLDHRGRAVLDVRVEDVAVREALDNLCRHLLRELRVLEQHQLQHRRVHPAAPRQLRARRIHTHTHLYTGGRGPRGW